MTSPSVLSVKPSRTTSWRRFVRHLVEMVAAMIVGMVVLAPVWVGVFALLGCSSLLEHADVHAMAMATDMSAGMALWMRHRHHGWASIGEMVAAMYLPFLLLFVPYWLGLVSAGTMLTAGHALMVPCMIAVMLRRREEYTRDHHRHPSPGPRQEVGAG
jgi:uncharacterized protein YceK